MSIYEPRPSHSVQRRRRSKLAVGRIGQEGRERHEHGGLRHRQRVRKDAMSQPDRAKEICREHLTGVRPLATVNANPSGLAPFD